MEFVHESIQNQIEEYQERLEDPDFLDYGDFSPLRRDLLLAGTRAYWRQKGEQCGNVDSLILSHPLPPCMSVDFNINLDNLYQDWIELEIDHQAAVFPVPSSTSTVDGDDAAVPEFDDTASTVVVDFNPVDDTASTVVVDFNPVEVLPSVEDHALDSAGVDGAGVDDDDDDEVTLKLWSPDDDADNADLDDVPVPPPAKKLRQSLLAFTYK
jgi:hypothetical protein